MVSFELSILVLHPRLDDVKDEGQILAVNERVLKPLPQKFSNPWFCEIRYADVEKELDATITFRRVGMGPNDPEFRKVLDAFCDDLFCPTSENSLESIRNGQEVLFKPVASTANNNVDRAFLRSFVISMGKKLTGHATLTNLQTLGNNFFTRDPANWFMGPMKAAVTVTECLQALGCFLELIPPRTITSTIDNATKYIRRTPAQARELEDTRNIEMVLDIMRGGNLAAMFLQEVELLKLVDLNEAALHSAINDASQFLDETTEQLVSTFDTLLDQYSHHKGEMSPASIETAVNSLKSCIEQTGQFYKMADTETHAYKKARNTWALFTVLSLAATVASCFIPGGPVALKVVALCGGVVPTTICGCKTYNRWCDMKNSDEVRKLVDKVYQVFRHSWIFLIIALWRYNGLPDDDPRLVEFAQRMAEVFDVHSLLENWASNGYAQQTLSTNRDLIAQDMRDILRAVGQRRTVPAENQRAEATSAQTASPDHDIQEKTVLKTEGLNVSQSNASTAESRSNVGGLAASSVDPESNGSSAELRNDLSIPSLAESHVWEIGSDESDLDYSGVRTPSEGSNGWVNH